MPDRISSVMNAPPRKFLAYFTLALIFLAGCSGKKSMHSPQLYGDHNSGSPKTDDRGHKVVDDTSQVGASGNSGLVDSLAEPNGEGGAGSLDAHRTRSQQDGWLADPSVFYSEEDVDDSASAVDDDIWRQFDLAEEYHSMGVIANREASWEEAQYYFEKALKIMANLDIEADTTQTPEALKYSRLLDDLVADYRVTLRSLGHLESDVSASVLIERFGDVGKGFEDDTMAVYSSESGEVAYDIPIVLNDRVKSSIIYFQTVAKEAFEKYLRRSKRYTPLMREILKEHGLPEDLIYLSLVESGYNPHAYSWARAMGLWQFISSTGRLYGLNRNWWIDERKDPVKATRAACRFLGDLYKEFGDWELAMAAYNGGPGRVRRTIKRQGTMDFWKMKLKRQTMDYVPLIMAAAIIAKNPEKYGFHDIDYEPELSWDEVEINKCLELSVVAREVGCSVEKLKELNPELLRKYTPPNTKHYRLKIPVGTRQKFLLAYDKMPSPKETSWVKHTIRRGETVSSIASRYGVSQYAILEANNLSRRSTIYAGKAIIVPVPLDREYSPSRKDDYSAKNSIYTVRSGDTMWDIARAFGTSVSSLRRINYIERGSRIYVGQKIKIPSGATKLRDNETPSSPRTYASANNSGSSGGTQATYRVRAGDTLWDIARKFGTTTGRIRSLNNLGRSSRIYPGEELRISGNAPRFVVHHVRRGDTMSEIARHYRTSIAKIMASNGKTNPDDLVVGEELKIYSQ